MSAKFIGLAAFAVAATSAALWWRALRRVEIPDNRATFITAWIVALVLGVAALLAAPGWLVGTLASLSVLVCCLLLLTVAIGGQKVGNQAIRVGMTIPAFTTVDEHGRTFDSSSLAGNPALIKFFRGHW